MDVERILVEGGRAHGVRLASGETITASRGVICNVTPTQLYGRLLAESEQVPAALSQKARAFRYGPAGMMIHLALKEAPRWTGDARLAQSPIIMINGELNQVSKSWNEGIRGLLPAEPVICLGNPTVVDPSRAPAGGAVLAIQLLGLPNRPVGDAAGKIQADGTWSEAVAERFAERVLHQVARFAPNLPSAIVGQSIVSPADLSRANINHVNGDPYGGSLEIAQHYLWRPMPGHGTHATPVAGVYQIGASTFPGHGLGGGSGLLVANQLLDS
ncbi:MAG TPA: NAD(P)/FAD-dependent oxidoreductase, partial [Symbiobacteriaceae bacterium]|nr:NAD(P)/FAD-dependent oxidoreductase [Symbiobacteriaceae bacterium]